MSAAGAGMPGLQGSSAGSGNSKLSAKLIMAKHIARAWPLQRGAARFLARPCARLLHSSPGNKSFTVSRASWLVFACTVIRLIKPCLRVGYR